MRTSFSPLLFLLCFLALGFVGAAYAADTTCGSQACSETVCARSDVMLCSDWNDGASDGWSLSSNVGTQGDIEPGVGWAGSTGWRHDITPGTAVTIIAGTSHPPTDRLHTRFAFRLSPNYKHGMVCGLQKLFYNRMLDSSGQLQFRIMLGLTHASALGGEFASLDKSVGVVGFDYPGHIVELPNTALDVPVLIYPDRWYSVELLSEWKSQTENTVKIWIDGVLSLTRTNYPSDTYVPGALFNHVRDTSWFGGLDSCNTITETQYIYKDNYVVGTEYIGPVESGEPPPVTDPATLGIPGVPESSAP